MRLIELWRLTCVIYLLGSCSSTNNEANCSLYQQTIDSLVMLDVNITHALCKQDTVLPNTTIIELFDTSGYPFPELDELRASYLVSRVTESISEASGFTITTKYINYTNDYIIPFETKDITINSSAWVNQPQKKEITEYLLSSFISEDWALLNALNDSLSPTFVDYNNLSVLDKILAAAMENSHYSIMPSAADNLALLYGLVNIYSKETALKLEPVFRTIEYKEYKDVKYVKKRFKHFNSFK